MITRKVHGAFFTRSPQEDDLGWLDGTLKVGELARLFCSSHSPELGCSCRCPVATGSSVPVGAS